MQTLQSYLAFLFSYDCHASIIRAFCECWCPTTNTLHTSVGEVSIFLWDLYHIDKLHIIGFFYDEMVPTVERLSKSSFSPSCQNLFLTYHWICSKTKMKSLVKMVSWVSFWYKGPMKYVKTPKKSTRNKMQRSKETHNPPRNIDPIKSCT